LEVTVSEQAKRFYLAFDKWQPAVGHEINVGKYRFCAIPLSSVLNISEVTSGAKVLNIPMTLEIMMITVSKEDSIEYFKQVGQKLKLAIERAKDFDEHVSNMKQMAFERLGEMPPIEEFDDWIEGEINGVIN
jgi:hypothetical protein